MTALEELKNKIDKITEARDLELKKLIRLKEENAATIAECDSAILKAKYENDLSAYREAKARRSEAIDAEELFTARDEALKGKNLITEEEYQAVSEAVFTELDAENAAALEKVTALMDKIVAITGSLQKNFDEANELLQIWQDKIYNDPNLYFENRPGVKIPRPGAALRYRKYALCNIVKEWEGALNYVRKNA